MLECYAIPDSSEAPPARFRGHASSGARDPAGSSQFIYPLFVVPGAGIRKEISSMPGNFQLSIDETASKECAEAESLGIGGVILFGIPETKTRSASGAYDGQGIVQQAIRAIKKEHAQAAGHHRRLQLRIHQPRPLRKDRQRRCR